MTHKDTVLYASFLRHCVSLTGVTVLDRQGSFAEYTLFYRALLQKRPRILRLVLQFWVGIVLYQFVGTESHYLFRLQRSLLQKIVFFIGLFCKSDLEF